MADAIRTVTHLRAEQQRLRSLIAGLEVGSQDQQQRYKTDTVGSSTASQDLLVMSADGDDVTFPLGAQDRVQCVEHTAFSTRSVAADPLAAVPHPAPRCNIARCASGEGGTCSMSAAALQTESLEALPDKPACWACGPELPPTSGGRLRPASHGSGSVRGPSGAVATAGPVVRLTAAVKTPLLDGGPTEQRHAHMRPLAPAALPSIAEVCMRHGHALRKLVILLVVCA